MELLQSIIILSEKAANVARLCRQNQHLFQLLIQQKSGDESNPRFVEDFKTLADVLIQEMVKCEIGKQFPELRDYIRGEENNIFCNKLGETIQVEMKSTAEETAKLLQVVLNGDKEAAQLLALEVHRNISLDEVNTKKPEGKIYYNFHNLGMWIDPIDSTAEYINGMEKLYDNSISLSGLKCVTVLIGVYDRETKMPVMGVINQPFIEEIDSKWRGTCVWGISTASNKFSSVDEIPDNNRLICISSSETDEIKTKLKSKDFSVVEVSGAGYKMLTVINGLADAYILSKSSTFKWDTCGPQAILKSLGGDLLNYKELTRNNIVSVEYDNENELENKVKSNCNYDGIIAFRNSEVLQDMIECLSEK